METTNDAFYINKKVNIKDLDEESKTYRKIL